MLDYLLAGGILAFAALYLVRYFLRTRRQAGCAKCATPRPLSAMRSRFPGTQL